MAAPITRAYCLGSVLGPLIFGNSHISSAASLPVPSTPLPYSSYCRVGETSPLRHVRTHRSTHETHVRHKPHRDICAQGPALRRAWLFHLQRLQAMLQRVKGALGCSGGLASRLSSWPCIVGPVTAGSGRLQKILTKWTC